MSWPYKGSKFWCQVDQCCVSYQNISQLDDHRRRFGINFKSTSEATRDTVSREQHVLKGGDIRQWCDSATRSPLGGIEVTGIFQKANRTSTGGLEKDGNASAGGLIVDNFCHSLFAVNRCPLTARVEEVMADLQDPASHELPSNIPKHTTK
uniref:Uncharacterized protein n=1 Tax=Coccidioides posadasii RMSCC 3488 TaxID=454284 RepID=A0A0J6F118_COCPO|nr:hypothetical protein CPAG_02909 [Coccidioides posadasii RMSCC 3488]